MRIITLILSLAVSIAGSAWADEAAKPAAAEAERPAAADFALDTLDGKRVKLSDHKGKVVVVSFWASWCKPCKQELPFLDAFDKQYAEQGFEVISVNTDDARTMPEVRRFVKRKKLKIPVGLDKDGAVLARLNPRGVMPFTLYIDREGRIAETHDSFTSGDEVKVEASIKKLLAEKAPTP